MLFEKQLKEKAEELLRQEEEKLKKGSKKGLWIGIIVIFFINNYIYS